MRSNYTLHLSNGRQIETKDKPERRQIERDWGYERWVTCTDVHGTLWQIRPEHLMALEHPTYGDQEDQSVSNPS
jgi:hypothetical protein